MFHRLHPRTRDIPYAAVSPAKLTISKYSILAEYSGMTVCGPLPDLSCPRSISPFAIQVVPDCCNDNEYIFHTFVYRRKKDLLIPAADVATWWVFGNQFEHYSNGCPPADDDYQVSRAEISQYVDQVLDPAVIESLDGTTLEETFLMKELFNFCAAPEEPGDEDGETTLFEDNFDMTKRWLHRYVGQVTFSDGSSYPVSGSWLDAGVNWSLRPLSYASTTYVGSTVQCPGQGFEASWGQISIDNRGLVQVVDSSGSGLYAAGADYMGGVSWNGCPPPYSVRSWSTQVQTLQFRSPDDGETKTIGFPAPDPLPLPDPLKGQCKKWQYRIGYSKTVTIGNLMSVKIGIRLTDTICVCTGEPNWTEILATEAAKAGLLKLFMYSIDYLGDCEAASSR